MVNAAQFSTAILANIALLHEDGVTQRLIAARLSVSKSGAQKAIARIKNTGSAKQLQHTGRPRSTKSQTDQFIQRTFKVTPTISTPISAPNFPVKLVQKQVNNEMNLKIYCSFAKTAAFSQKFERRLRFCHAHLNWATHQWRKVMFSDVTLTNIQAK